MKISSIYSLFCLEILPPLHYYKLHNASVCVMACLFSDEFILFEKKKFTKDYFEILGST